MPKAKKASPELMAERSKVEALTREMDGLTREVATLRKELELYQVPKPVLARAATVESGMQKLLRIITGG